MCHFELLRLFNTLCITINIEDYKGIVFHVPDVSL